MAIEESKIIDLIDSYEKYEEECRDSWNAVDNSRAALYRTVISDLEDLLPRKTLADLEVPHFSDLTGTMIEYVGRRGVLLGGNREVVSVFTFADKMVNWCKPENVLLLNEDRAWDEAGVFLI